MNYNTATVGKLLMIPFFFLSATEKKKGQNTKAELKTKGDGSDSEPKQRPSSSSVQEKSFNTHSD